MQKVEYMPRVTRVPGSSTEISLTQRNGLTLSGSPSVIVSQLRNERNLRLSDNLLSVFVVGSGVINAIKSAQYLPFDIASHDVLNGLNDGIFMLFVAALAYIAPGFIVRNFRRNKELAKEEVAIGSFLANAK